MDALRTHVAGVDVHKEVLAITVLRGDAGSVPEEVQFDCLTFTEDLIKGGRKLLDLGVKEVAMESTGVYWKPIHNVWSPMGIELTVGQAAHMKNVPGRKTDMNDSHWIAHLHRHGFIRPSLIPENAFQKVRRYTRHRENLVNDLTRVKNRIQKTLEDGNIKWGSVASDVFGKAGLAILRLLADGVTDADSLSAAVTTNIKKKDLIKKSLRNCFDSDHSILLRSMMEQYDQLEKQIVEIDDRLEELLEPHKELVDKLDEIPGVDVVLARSILAEATDDMTKFKDERAFAAWSGVASGNNESAGKKKDRNAAGVIPTCERR